MKKITSLLLPLVASGVLYSAASQAAVVDYQLDSPHTSIVVSWDHFGFSHPTAVIPGATGVIKFDPQHPAGSSVNVSIPVSNIDTHVPALTKEFQGSDYFDTAKYSTATFTSTKVISRGEHRYDVEGNLTLKGVTKPVTLHATLNKIGEQAMVKKQAVGFNATGTLQRSAFGIDKYVPAVSDAITLTISTEAYAQ
ncbi:polyisoprenoid-binding protein [Rosenbergiella australiborealis]|uniref:Polyisoprenoid-binding protein n=1 Tax=Rosenbergiella australiborealis TaxID=1544696 RepID=A0ABS5TC55_9GAMM|nr:YceI family protein [Rosenbergiella australiborealis]MBT0728503.1 polyisoprenoid-binding protein [Rosenbergiella australiborealis]